MGSLAQGRGDRRDGGACPAHLDAGIGARGRRSRQRPPRPVGRRGAMAACGADAHDSRADARRARRGARGRRRRRLDRRHARVRRRRRRLAGLGRRVDVALEQRAEEGRSLAFDTPPLTERVEILGFPRARLAVSADQPQALLAVRLCDVAPDGSSTLVTRGVLNLTHRESHETPNPSSPARSSPSRSSSTRSRTPFRPATASGSPSRRPTGRGLGRRPPWRS